MKITALPYLEPTGAETTPVVLNGKTYRTNTGALTAKLAQPYVDAAAAAAAAAQQALSDAAGRLSGGPMANGVWVRAPALPKILLGGNGTVTIDLMTRDGAITANVAAYAPTGSLTEDWLYFDNARAFRATLTGSATAEII